MIADALPRVICPGCGLRILRRAFASGPVDHDCPHGRACAAAAGAQVCAECAHLVRGPVDPLDELELEIVRIVHHCRDLARDFTGPDAVELCAHLLAIASDCSDALEHVHALKKGRS